MGNKSTLAEKYRKIMDELGDQTTFYMDDIQVIFPDMKKSSLYWNISKMVEHGYIKRIRNGVFAFNEWYGKKSITLSDTAIRIADIMDETGFDYYISGLDVLQKYMQHVPEQYPCILFINKNAKEEVEDILQENGMETLLPLQIKEMHKNHVLAGKQSPQAVLYRTDNFADSEDGIASIEKAFVDLFYAVTRNAYPLALQELVRIYANVVRLGILDKKKMVTVASKRSLQYDIRYIAESKFITEEAHKFVEILRREE